MGVSLEHDYEINEHLSLHRTKIDAPYFEMEECAETQEQYGLLISLAPHVTFELRASAETTEDALVRSWNGQWFLMLMSIVIDHPIHFPVQSSHSGADIRLAKTHIENVYFGQTVFAPPKMVSSDEVTRVTELYGTFSSMLGVKRFTHACVVACNSHREPNRSVRIAAIWSGIEALMGFDYELRFRLALSIAQVLESDGIARRQRFLAVRALYDQRSKCVHGAGLAEDALAQCLSDSRALLNELILFFAARGSLMGPDEWTQLSLGG
ncbi:MAG: hypothetical protein EOP22_19390 [Hyphomicrobiales bacterium]|nr:MAG: hypothetical protein EOP22_19390 [Hyphomicrobiales bacterium]